MQEVKYGLSESGFKRKRLPEIIQDDMTRISDKLGVPIQTTSNSVIYQLNAVHAYEIADLWELAESIYKAMYPSTSTGVSLSNAAGLAGIQLNEATKTMLIATCYGLEGTVIPYSAQISSSTDSTLIFSCIETDAKITADKASYIDLVIGEIQVGKEYMINCSGTRISYIALENDTKTTVLAALQSKLSSVDGVNSNLKNDVLTIRTDNQEQSVSIILSGLSSPKIGTPIKFSCDTYGAINPAIGEVNLITTTYAGWQSVYNNVNAVVGIDAETDTQLRQRWSSGIYKRASAMTEAIKEAVAQVDGVTAVRVYENTSDENDEQGRLPHSIEVVVAGGIEQQIAQAIWSRKSGGIDTFGSISADAIDIEGYSHNIKFNRPEKLKIWLKVTIYDTPDEVFPAAGLSEISNAILNAGLAFKIGQDVILQRFGSVIFGTTSGIGYFDITATTGDVPEQYGRNNIVISARQIADFSALRIEVTKANV